MDKYQRPEGSQQSLLKELVDCLHLIAFPSKLWAFHIDPEYKFITAIHLSMETFTSLNIDKGILIWFDNTNHSFKVSFYIYNELVNIPTLECDIKTVSDLSQLINIIHNLKLCVNSNKKNVTPFCQKYIIGENLEMCEECHVCNNIERADHSFDDSPVYDALIYDTKLVKSNYMDHTNDLRRNDNDMFLESNPKKQNDIQNDTTDVTFKKLQSNENFHAEHDNSQNLCDVSREAIVDIKVQKKKGNDKLYLCEFCPKNFSSQSKLKKHLQFHSSEPPFQCKICKKTSSCLSAHQRHEMIHLNVKPNLCSVCGKTFCQGYRMEDHLLTHSSDKPFECNICKKRFAKSYNLKLHQKIHTGVRPYICSACGKTYTSQSNLSTHTMSVHTNKKPHACVNCHMSFVHPHLLKLHMRKHTGEKPYKCSLCGKTFAKNIHLTVHTRTHSGEKPHMCTVCGKGFITTGNLSSHRRVHHKNVSADVAK